MAESHALDVGAPTPVERVLLRWRGVCARHARMHDMARAHFRWLNHATMVSSIVLSSVASASSLGVASVGDPCARAASWFIVAFNAVGLAASCIISVHRFLGLAELQKEHDFYSDMYDMLAKEIDMQLALDAEADGAQRMFASLGEFSKHCKGRMDVFIDKGPALPAFIARRVPADGGGAAEEERCA